MQTAAHKTVIQDPLLDDDATAEYLGGIATNTLSAWRKTGRGPKFLKLGAGRTAAVRYRRSDLDAWLESCVRTSTSDQGTAA